jgi:hypothetical protein
MTCVGNPDGTMVCSCYKSWSCEEVLGQKKCTQHPADQPDGSGGWICKVEGAIEKCVRSGNLPAGKNGWTCTKAGNQVTCTRPTNTPDGGSNWSCTYVDSDLKVCKSGTPPKTDAGVPKKDTTTPPPPKTDSGVPPKTDIGGGSTWNCYKDAIGNNICTKNDEGFPPGGGQWTCQWKQGQIICDGSSSTPPGGGGWTCVPKPEVGGWECKKPQELPPGGGTWNCTSGTGAGGTICVQPPPPKPGQACVPNQKRWCDGEVYCSYGQQVCLPTGQWDPKCVELPSGVRPATMCACYFFYFNPDCCETPDCIVPPGTNGQVCKPSNGAYCDYCNPENPECKGAGAKCVATVKNETFCGQDCSGGKACPANSLCTPFTKSGQTYWQCLPADQSCYY